VTRLADCGECELCVGASACVCCCGDDQVLSVAAWHFSRCALPATAAAAIIVSAHFNLNSRQMYWWSPMSSEEPMLVGALHLSQKY
jgi:hypothetical protein